MFGWIILAIIAIISCIVLYVSDQPGHRRRRQDERYSGPERRNKEYNGSDFFRQPAFRNRRCKECDKLYCNESSEEDCKTDFPTLNETPDGHHI